MSAVEQVKAYHTPALLSRRNVVGVAVGHKIAGGKTRRDLAVTVLVQKKLPPHLLSPQDLIPQELDSIPTDVVEVGYIQAPPPGTVALQEDPWTKQYPPEHPAPPGVSIGHRDITAGTFGCLVQRTSTSPYRWDWFILSNNHVLANSNAGKLGDPIIQPGPYDGGTYDIGSLHDFIPISFATGGVTCALVKFLLHALNSAARAVGSSHCFSASTHTPTLNHVDAAIAEPHTYSDVTPEIMDGVGLPRGVRKGTLGTRVQKCGRTTHHTYDTINQMHATVQVGYGGGRVAIFEEQLIAGPMSAGGDSGSLVLDMENYAIGLLFAGSEQVTIFSPIAFALEGLGVELVT